MSNDPTGAGAADQTRNVGRGALYLTATKFYFIGASFFIYFGITAVARALGQNEVALLGDYKAVNNLLSVVSPVLMAGSMQAIARFIGQRPGASRLLIRRSLAIQSVLGIGIGIAFYFGAESVAGRQQELVRPLQVAALIPVIYAFYAVMMGSLNGLQRFASQAFVDGAFTTLKLVLVLASLFVFQSVTGAYIGFATSAAICLAISVAVLLRRGGLPQGTGEVAHSVSGILGYQLKTIGFMSVVQWLVQMDLWYLLWWGTHAREADDAVKGLYGGSQLFAQLPYSAVISLTFVLFPLISRLDVKTDAAAARAYVREALRYAMIIAFLIAIPISAAPARSLMLLVKDVPELASKVEGGVECLRWLGLGFIAFSLHFVLSSVLNAAGRAATSLSLMLAVVGVQAALSYVLIPTHGPLGASIAGAIAMSLGFLAAILLLSRLLGPFFPLASAARILVASSVSYAISILWNPPSLLLRLSALALAAMAFLATLILLREFSETDRERFRRILSRKRRA